MDIKYRDGRLASLDTIEAQIITSELLGNKPALHRNYSDATILALIDKIKEQEEIIKGLRDKIESPYPDHGSNQQPSGYWLDNDYGGVQPSTDKHK